MDLARAPCADGDRPARHRGDLRIRGAAGGHDPQLHGRAHRDPLADRVPARLATADTEVSVRLPPGRGRRGPDDRGADRHLGIACGGRGDPPAAAPGADRGGGVGARRGRARVLWQRDRRAVPHPRGQADRVGGPRRRRDARPHRRPDLSGGRGGHDRCAARLRAGRRAGRARDHGRDRVHDVGSGQGRAPPSPRRHRREHAWR